MQSEVIFVAGPIPRAPHGDGGAAAASREIGAVVEFRGIVRESEGAEKIAGLFYEAYEPMARREFACIFAELAVPHPIHAVRVWHSLGEVRAGEASLFVRVEAKHRAEALAFCGALIDRMKADVPIWKSPVAATPSSPAVSATPRRAGDRPIV